jgi:hypothetical protein
MATATLNGRAPSCALDDLRDAQERQPSIQEGRHGDLVCGVEDARHRPSCFSSRAGERKAGERLLVWRRELEDEVRGKVERGDRRGGPVGVGEGKGDGHAHVRVADVGERGTVPQADERVHDRRRMDDDLDALVGQVEEEVRLDQLEALVHERRRVDRDLRAHVPRRVRERLGGRDPGELGAAAATERPSRCREDQRINGLGDPPLEELKRGRMLRVDRQDAALPLLRGGNGEVPRDDEALLVREREVDATLERPHRRRKACKSDDGVQDDVRLGPLEQLGQIPSNLRDRGDAVDRLGARCGGDELEVRVGLDDLERLRPNRSCGPQQGDALHAIQCRERPATPGRGPAA